MAGTDSDQNRRTTVTVTADPENLERVRQLLAQACAEKDQEKLKVLFEDIFEILERQNKTSHPRPNPSPSERE